LYLDGARLGSALASNENDLTLPEISKLVDIFYIGELKWGNAWGSNSNQQQRTKRKLQTHIKTKRGLTRQRKNSGATIFLNYSKRTYT